MREHEVYVLKEGDVITPIERGITEATKKKMSDSWDYNKHFTKKIREKMSEAAKKRWQTRIFPKKDTLPELIFICLCNRFGIANKVEDTRDNSFHIGRVNPDFIIRDMRIAIFVNGDYWHSALLRPNLKYTNRPEKQISECKKHKWKAMILWESDLKRKDTEQFVLLQLQKQGVI